MEYLVCADESNVANRSYIIETDNEALLKCDRHHIANAPLDDNDTQDKDQIEQRNDQPSPRRTGKAVKPSERLIGTMK